MSSPEGRRVIRDVRYEHDGEATFGQGTDDLEHVTSRARIERRSVISLPIAVFPM
jgi:hypothetical protein